MKNIYELAPVCYAYFGGREMNKTDGSLPSQQVIKIVHGYSPLKEKSCGRYQYREKGKQNSFFFFF